MTRRVTFVVYPDFQSLDLAGPLEVFQGVNRYFGDQRKYTTELVAVDAGSVHSSSGLEIGGVRPTRSVRGPIDTLVVVGGTGSRAAERDDELVRWIAAAAKRSRRVTSVCSGAFLLARAGVLDSKRATTHWSDCERLATTFPKIMVDPDPIFVRDGDVWTSAGVTAGMDLALALIEEDHGPEVARTVARWLVLFIQRPGGQAQFSTQLAAQRPERAPLRELQAWMPDHLGDDLSVPGLAVRAGMSERNFARAFRRELGMTPGAYVEAMRVEAAQRLLETTTDSIEAIARSCGFGTVETMHRTFKRTVRVTPGDYRRHFHPHAAA
jgi:transcriptional regulator GlxA family with amidase domain